MIARIFFWEVLAMHVNKLRLFLAKVFPPALIINVALPYIIAVGTIFNVFSYDKRMHYVLRNGHGFIFFPLMINPFLCHKVDLGTQIICNQEFLNIYIFLSRFI